MPPSSRAEPFCTGTGATACHRRRSCFTSIARPRPSGVEALGRSGDKASCAAITINAVNSLVPASRRCCFCKCRTCPQVSIPSERRVASCCTSTPKLTNHSEIAAHSSFSFSSDFTSACSAAAAPPASFSPLISNYSSDSDLALVSLNPNTIQHNAD